ncbi:adenylosuccinate synthase [Thermomonospora echinospora]|uniref:Adenylosuccinate synthetase n=1 Tax=Thermomonospora echinospora TaxID=1992 RepID=A0A1H6BDD0_9ACTN|nr:adenylosuccinate synthetase [Thermomonospora echinospora]SEG58789.1 adenylosuccinate synthase [Thermomonospora echinospora]
MTHRIVVDLGFGDAGKGTVVDWLCSRGHEGRGTGTGDGESTPVHAVVRFNGGAQAAHNVVAPDGRHHTFAQFGSGTLTPGVRTHLSRFMLVDPLALAAEARHLARLGVADALDRLTVDGDALLTTPYHRAAGRARETARGPARHGSCGMGIGETMAYSLAYPGDAPRVADCLSPARLRRRLAAVRDWFHDAFPGAGQPVPDVADCLDAFTAFAGRVRVVGGAHLAGLLRAGPVVFEGAQGVLLDEWHGFHPYTTWSTTTFANAETLLAEAGASAVRLGVVRAYMTRHGPGPFVTEDPALTADLPDRHNAFGPWQGAFRVGHLDLVALRYALEVSGGADALAVTHLDVSQTRRDLLLCRAYEMDGRRIVRLPSGPPGDLGGQEALTRRLLAARPVYGPLEDPVAALEAGLGVPVALRSYGPTADDKRAAVPITNG